MSESGHILVVDDQQEICDLVREYLTDEGFRVSTASNGAGLREEMARGPVDLVILDLVLPGEDGLQLARELRSGSDIGIIMLTGRAEMTGSLASKWAPTITCRSRSTCANCWRGCAACCGVVAAAASAIGPSRGRASGFRAGASTSPAAS